MDPTNEDIHNTSANFEAPNLNALMHQLQKNVRNDKQASTGAGRYVFK
jgi:hypothetical protein